jgi:amino acid transporter
MVKSQRQMSRGPAWVAGALLILQGVGLMGIGAYFFGRIDWDRALVVTNGQGLIDVQTVDGPWLEPLEQAALFATYYIPPAVLLLLAGLSFLIVRRRGWLLAITAQSLILLACLFGYPDPRPGFVYPIIASCILLVLYLNSRGVRTAAQSQKMLESRGSETTHGR